MKKNLWICSLVLLVLSSCTFKNVKGDGNIVTKTYTESGFKDIDVSSSVEVYLTQGTAYSLKITGEKNILELMNVKTKGDKLEIGFKNNTSFSATKPVKIYITAPGFRNLDGSGACSFYSQQKITSTGEVMIDLSGSCTAQLDIDAKKIVIDASGATEITLKGTATDLAVDASGSTSIHCFDFITQNTTLDISGAGEAEVFASKSLGIDISGASSVQYKGSPASLKQEISGAGSVNKAD